MNHNKNQFTLIFDFVLNVQHKCMATYHTLDDTCRGCQEQLGYTLEIFHLRDMRILAINNAYHRCNQCNTIYCRNCLTMHATVGQAPLYYCKRCQNPQ